MPGMNCDWAGGCTNTIQKRCSSCNRSFCIRHFREELGICDGCYNIASQVVQEAAQVAKAKERKNAVEQEKERKQSNGMCLIAALVFSGGLAICVLIEMTTTGGSQNPALAFIVIVTYALLGVGAILGVVAVIRKMIA
jgi:K+-sensing histidine kinase KdpD